MRSPAILFAVLLLCEMFGGSGARADKRVALVIGNSAYTHAPKLPNPENDAAAIGLLFKSIGFDVVEVKQNLGVGNIRQAVRDFTDVSRDSDIAVIYYAGHGIEFNGSNYLVPIDAAMKRDVDVEDETVSLDRLLTALEPARKLKLVILDACRDSPFTSGMRRTLASRSIGRGLAKVEPVSSDTLVAYAAKAGSTAADGGGTHSPFTAALLQHLATPGLDLRIAFGRVRDEVLAKTDRKQEPFVYGSLGGAAVTLASLSAGERIDAPRMDADAPAARDYEAAAKIGTKEAWDAFLAKYSAGFYADLARAQRANIIAKLSPSSEPTASRPAKRKDPQQSTVTSTGRERKRGEGHTLTKMSDLTPEYCRTYFPNGANPSWGNDTRSQAGRETWRLVVRACGASH